MDWGGEILLKNGEFFFFMQRDKKNHFSYHGYNLFIF